MFVSDTKWFEVVYCFTDARGDNEMILYCGPLENCQEAAAMWDGDDLIIREISF